MKALTEILQEFEDRTRQEERELIRTGVSKVLQEKYNVVLTDEDWILVTSNKPEATSSCNCRQKNLQT